jgi:inosine/xanthosine triphosphatase
MKVAVAGTFDVLHAGHRALIDRAFDISDRVFVGITSDAMASAGRKSVNPLWIRRKMLQEYLSSKEGRWEIFEIDDIYGPREIMDDVETLVISEETLGNSRLVNEDRRRRGLRPLEFSIVPLVRNDAGERISSTGIRSGAYGRNGRKGRDIAVGSTNPVKVEAARCVMEKVFGDVTITAVDADSGVPEQPFGEETLKGAINRAKAALGNHWMAIGIEAGVFEMYDGLYDIQHCAVVSREGVITVGMSSGFRYPDDVAHEVRGGLTVGEAMEKVFGENKGRSEGAVGILSKGLIDRKELTEQSVKAAMIPRMRGL